MQLKWHKRRCVKCERLKLTCEFHKKERVCERCKCEITYPVDLIRKQVLIYGSKQRVAEKLEIDLDIVERICDGRIR